MTAKILIVEDEALIARDIRATLKTFGYVVDPPVASGPKALEAMVARSPDLVLMDIRIHGDMDGIETATKIRELHGTPVVYLTSHSDEATVARAKGTGAYGYVLKPFNERDLRIAIEVALEKREIERRIAERERWFATTLKSIGDAVIATDAAQRITFMNGVAERVTGFSEAEARGKRLGEVLRLVEPGSGASIDSPLTSALEGGFAVELPRGTGLTTREGTRRDVDDSAAPIVDDAGRTVGGVVVFRDVTERRQLEERLARNERLASIGTLSAGMAHEINNPLAAVLGNVSFAVEALDELSACLGRLSNLEDRRALASRIDQIRGALEDARDGSNRVHRIVHDLKRFGRVEGDDRRVVELTDVLEGALRMSSNTVRHQARIHREYRTTPFVDVNEGQLTQVFVNLLINAGQACGDPVEDEIVVATYTDDAGRAVAEVRDSGQGVPAEIQRRIFDPFFTTKPVGQGTGLGLSIAHGIVTSAGGQLDLVTGSARGATFRVSLPPATRKDRVAPEPPPPTPTRRGRVLVIDDEPSIGRVMARMLQRDHDVFVHEDARDALSRMAAGETFDVVFCDLTMPGMDGMGFLDAVRASHPNLARRIVFVTGGAVTERAERFLESTANATMTKPIAPTDVLRIVADHLARED